MKKDPGFSPTQRFPGPVGVEIRRWIGLMWIRSSKIVVHPPVPARKRRNQPGVDDLI